MSDGSPTAAPSSAPTAVRVLQVDCSPHVNDQGVTTRGMMVDVLFALVPAVIAAHLVFGVAATRIIVLCLLGALGGEWCFGRLLGRRFDLGDGSAAITGLILALSLPAAAPWWVCILAAVVALGLGKLCFGGLGHNIFNPAMVGRAFVMLSFAKHLSGGAYTQAEAGVAVMTQATPLTAGREAISEGATAGLGDLFLGTVNGSLGETSALALLLGGIYLCLRRSASWEIPVSASLALAALTGLAWGTGLSPLSPLHHLLAGAFLLGALFIATDPVTSPVTRCGKLIYGAGFGILVVALRLLSSYPEGVMFAVLLMNGCAPLIDRLTIPKPLGFVPAGGRA